MGVNLVSYRIRFKPLLRRIIQRVSFTEKQFFVGNDIGLDNDTDNFLSIMIAPRPELANLKDADGNPVDLLAVCVDEVVNGGSKTFVLNIYFNPDVVILKNESTYLFRVWTGLTHEFCHFVRLYELFLEYKEYHNFKNAVSYDSEESLKGDHSHSIAEPHQLFRNNIDGNLLETMSLCLNYFKAFSQEHYVPKKQISQTNYPDLCGYFFQFTGEILTE